jgi:putative SOS response-associated peptidase YedK
VSADCAVLRTERWAKRFRTPRSSHDEFQRIGRQPWEAAYGKQEELAHPKSGAKIQSCTVLTCGPNGVMAELHNRMPVILD